MAAFCFAVMDIDLKVANLFATVCLTYLHIFIVGIVHFSIDNSTF